MFTKLLLSLHPFKLIWNHYHSSTLKSIWDNHFASTFKEIKKLVDYTFEQLANLVKKLLYRGLNKFLKIALL